MSLQTLMILNMRAFAKFFKKTLASFSNFDRFSVPSQSLQVKDGKSRLTNVVSFHKVKKQQIWVLTAVLIR